LKSRPSVLTQARSRPRHMVDCLAEQEQEMLQFLSPRQTASNSDN